MSCCSAIKAQVMVALRGSFLFFSPASVSMAFLNAFSLHSDGLLLISYGIPFMGLHWVGCTSRAHCFIGQVKLFRWVGPSFTVNWAKSLFSPTLVRAPLPISHNNVITLMTYLMCKNTACKLIQIYIYIYILLSFI